MSSFYGQKIITIISSIVFLLSLSSMAADAPHPAGSNSAAAPSMTMPMVAPLFVVNGEFSSTLYMVNGLTVPATARVSVFDLSGTKISEQEVKFDADTEQHLDVGKLLSDAGSTATLGCVGVEALTQQGVGILAQLAITHHGAKDSYFDEELAMPSAMGSQILRAVADGGGGFSVVSITNLSSNSNQNVTITGIGEGGATTKTLVLSANQTKLVRPCAGEGQDRFDGSVASDFGSLANPSSTEACGISIAADGMPGTLAAYGFVYHSGNNDEGYFSAMTFSDPKVLRSSGLVYPGVPIGSTNLLPDGNYGARLMLANFGARDSNVTVQFASMIGGQAYATTLATIAVPANTAKVTEFKNLTGDGNFQNSFIVRSESAPGVVLSKLVSFSDGALREVEVIGKDEGQLENTGDHPWSVEDGVSSTLILFNHAATAETFFVKVGGNKMTWRKDYKLASWKPRRSASMT